MKTRLIITSLLATTLKSKMVASALFSKKGFLLIPMAVVSVTIKFEYTLKLLLWLMIIDFITGVLASYFERQKSKKIATPEELVKITAKHLISSEKLKLSGVKFILYMSTTLTAYFIQNIFFIKSFNFGFSEANFTISIVVVSFWCIVEFYSIVFENFKRMGIDVLLVFFKMFDKYKTTKDKLK
jgi:phage-related holin